MNFVRWRSTKCSSHGRLGLKNKFLPSGTTSKSQSNLTIVVTSVVENLHVPSYTLKRYIKRVHTHESLFIFELCEKCFSTADVLKGHKKIHEEKTFERQRRHKKLIEWYVLFAF